MTLFTLRFYSIMFRFFLCLWCCKVASTNSSYFKIKSYSNGVAIKRKAISVMSDSTRFECAHICTKDQHCSVASFERKIKVCRTFGKKISPLENFVHGPDVLLFKKFGHYDDSGKFIRSDLKTKVYRSCREVFEDHKSNGVYEVMLADRTKVDVYCIMEDLTGCGGGGWGLAMKIKGSESTFTYSSHWSSNGSLNYPMNLANLDNKELKSPIFWGMRVNQICIGMKYLNETNWVLIKQAHESLQSVFSSNKKHSTTLTKSFWTRLMRGSNMDITTCTNQGINVESTNTGGSYSIKLRIGLIGNKNVCSDPTWFIGMGASHSTSCGNVLLSSNSILNSFGYVLIQ